jgi:hypothetical protein
MTMKFKTIDEIKKSYEYKINPLDNVNAGPIEYIYLFGTFGLVFDNYKFDENIMEIKKKIIAKKDSIDKNKAESFVKILNEISENCKNLSRTIKIDFEETTKILSQIADNYSHNKGKPGAADIYVKICKDIIDHEVKKFIKYEKTLIIYNDQIISIRNNLIN